MPPVVKPNGRQFCQPQQRLEFQSVFNRGQARTLVKTNSGHPLNPLFALALTTGMRPSEYLGLTANDFDLHPVTVSLAHTLEWRRVVGSSLKRSGRAAAASQSSSLGSYPPSGASFRRKPRKEWNRVATFLLFRFWTPGTYPRVAFNAGPFKPLLRLAELPAIRLYDRRHTAATGSLLCRGLPKSDQ